MSAGLQLQLVEILEFAEIAIENQWSACIFWTKNVIKPKNLRVRLEKNPASTPIRYKKQRTYPYFGDCAVKKCRLGSQMWTPINTTNPVTQTLTAIVKRFSCVHKQFKSTDAPNSKFRNSILIGSYFKCVQTLDKTNVKPNIVYNNCFENIACNYLLCVNYRIVFLDWKTEFQESSGTMKTKIMWKHDWILRTTKRKLYKFQTTC